MAMLMCSIGLFLLLTGITYSFFNYTRTGSSNTFSVGRISFTSEEGPAINLINAFPINSSDIDISDYVGSITINITGDTEYQEGIEYLITATDINNKVGQGFGNRRIPISVDVNYTANGVGKSVGVENNNYFDDGVRGGDVSYYKLLSSNVILNENDPILVGYIAPGETGIDGNITIKTYFDEDKIAISDTFEIIPKYLPNPNATQENIDDCVSFLEEIGIMSLFGEGETPSSYCRGTGTMGGTEFVTSLTYNFTESAINYFLEHHVIIENYSNDTSEEWVGNRIILSTQDWTYIHDNGVSFKIKVEANLGTWVDDPRKIDTCPNCKYMFVENGEIFYMTSNNYNMAPTVITEGTTDNYLDIVNGLVKRYFIGVILNDNNEITNAYACGMRDGTPFCVEGTPDNTTYNDKVALLQSPKLWNNTCNSYLVNGYNNNPENLLSCSSSSFDSTAFEIHEHGCALVIYSKEDHQRVECEVEDYGRIKCH